MKQAQVFKSEKYLNHGPFPYLDLGSLNLKV